MITAPNAVEIALEEGFAAAYCLVPPGSLPEVEAWAASVLLMVMPYRFFASWPEGTAEVSAYYVASNRAHAAMYAVRERLSAIGVRAETRHSVRLKAFGAQRGLGTIGRNTLLRNDAWGSAFTMRALLLDIAPGEASALHPAAPCGDCRRCVDACPTGALSGPEGFSWALCLRANMFTGKAVPEPLREPMGLRLLGCDICQKACPYNGRAPEEAPEAAQFAIDALLRLKKEDLLAIANVLGKNEARENILLPQAILAAANSGDSKYINALEALLSHESEAVRTHAEWGIARLT